MSSDSPFFKESGMIGMCEPMTHFNLESPGGLVKVVAECQGGQVKSVNLESMPSFVGYMNKKVNYSSQCWKICPKKSHSTLRAKRAMFRF